MNPQNEHELQSSRYEGKFAAKKEKKKHRFPLGVRILLTVLITLLCLIIAAGTTLLILHEIGRSKQSLNPDTVVSFPSTGNDKALVQKDDTGRIIEYNGHTYQLNENLTSILFMGIDERITDKETSYGSAGQSDVILLITLDTQTGESHILCFPRDAYAEVDKYSIDGRYIGTENTQLCLAFAYGDQHELSARNTMASVERFLYGIQINSYVALDMRGILLANDSIGGVTLNALTDFTFYDKTTVKAGEKTTLLGKHAEAYIRSRTHETKDANVARMARQKQYAQTFAATVISQAKGDPTSLIDLYKLLDDYMVTDIGLDSATYLAPIVLKGGMNFGEVRIIDSTIEMVGDYPMYYLDENDLVDAVVSAFYKQID